MVKPTKPTQKLRMGVIGAAHGTGGELRVKAFTGDPMAIGGYGPLYTEDGRALSVVAVRPARDVVIVRFAEVGDRTAAEALTGATLYVDRAALPAELEDDEYYHADLVDLLVVDETGETLGKVAAVHDFGAGDIIEIALASGRREMIPFTRAAVPEIDIAEGILRVDSLAAGLDDAAGAGTGPKDGDEKDFDPGDRPRGPRSAGGNR